MIINATLFKPSVIKDSLIKIVDIMNPEFLMILWNLSELKKEDSNKKTSTRIKIWNNSSKKIEFKDFKYTTLSLYILSTPQL